MDPHSSPLLSPGESPTSLAARLSAEGHDLVVPPVGTPEKKTSTPSASSAPPPSFGMSSGSPTSKGAPVLAGSGLAADQSPIGAGGANPLSQSSDMGGLGQAHGVSGVSSGADISPTHQSKVPLPSSPPSAKPYGDTPLQPPTTTATDKLPAQIQPVVEGLRRRARKLSTDLGHAAEHPSVKEFKHVADKQVDRFRAWLGGSKFVLSAEKRTGVDRVWLVVGTVVAYILLIPLNLFHLAIFTTSFLTFLPPMYLSARNLDAPNPDPERTNLLLSYFVVFGWIQFVESLMPGILERRVPQYFTVKLAFLAYLIHPRTKGALKIHQTLLRPLLAALQTPSHAKPTTPPTSKPHTETGDSPLQRTTALPTPAPSAGITHATPEYGAPAPAPVSAVVSPTSLTGREVGEIPVVTAHSTGSGSGSLTADIQEIGMLPQSELGKVLGPGTGMGTGTGPSGVSGVSGATGTGIGTGVGVGGNVAEGSVSGGPGFKVVNELHRQAGTLGL